MKSKRFKREIKSLLVLNVPPEEKQNRLTRKLEWMDSLDVELWIKKKL